MFFVIVKKVKKKKGKILVLIEFLVKDGENGLLIVIYVVIYLVRLMSWVDESESLSIEGI